MGSRAQHKQTMEWVGIPKTKVAGSGVCMLRGEVWTGRWWQEWRMGSFGGCRVTGPTLDFKERRTVL